MSLLHMVSPLAAAAAALLLAAAPARAADDIVATAEKAGSFKTLIAAVKAAGLTEILSNSKQPLTVFAPTDDAFKKLPAGTLDTLLKPENKATLASILKYHVLPGKYSAERLQKAKAQQFTVRTAEGAPVPFNKKDGLTVGGARITKTDIGASNGTIHVIDTVILPLSAKRKLAGQAPGSGSGSGSGAMMPAAAAAANAPPTTPATPAPAAAPPTGGQPATPKATIPAVPAGPKK